MSDKTIEHRLAWLAGIIDGEGTIGLYYHKMTPSELRSQRSKGRTSTSRSCCFMVVVSNTDPGMIAEIRSIADVLGLSRANHQHFPSWTRHPNARPQWRVTFKSRKAVEPLLKAIYPYLITKRPQAELMLRAIAHRRSLGQPRRGQSSYVPVDADPIFANMVAEGHHLNRRGIAPKES